MGSELKPCPFCGYAVSIESNRDWHKLVGPHEPLCPLEDHEITYAADGEGLAQLRRDWNTRAQLDSGEWVSVPKGWKLVPEEPTDEMISEGADASKAFRVDILRSYEAMVNAAPHPPEETK